MSVVAKVKFANYAAGVAAALHAIGAAGRLPGDGLVIIKPNLTTADPPPVTTPVAPAEAGYDYCKANCGAEIAIGESSGSGRLRRAEVQGVRVGGAGADGPSRPGLDARIPAAAQPQYQDRCHHRHRPAN